MNTKPTPDPDEPRVDDRPAVRIFTTIESIAAAVGEHVGTTDWLRIDQQRIDDFADATDDHQWIHVDAERAAHGPFGTTVAHGYLTLALLPRFTVEAFALQTQARDSTTDSTRSGSQRRCPSGHASGGTPSS
jgi:acyl dehydratase